MKPLLKGVGGRALLSPTVALCLVMLLMLCPATAQNDSLPLVGYWPFEEPQGTAVLDASNRDHAGEIMNDSRGVKRAPGRTGNALEFSGGEAGQRNQAGALALKGMEQVDWSQGLTVELWVKLNKFDRPATYELVSNTVGDRGPGFRFVISWQSLALRSGEGGAGATWGAASQPSATALKVGEWMHVAATYDGSVFRVYVDGALAGESAPDLKLTPGEGRISVGSYRGGYAYGLDGLVDELKLYNVARSPAAIMADARLGR